MTKAPLTKAPATKAPATGVHFIFCVYIPFPPTRYCQYEYTEENLEYFVNVSRNLPISFWSNFNHHGIQFIRVDRKLSYIVYFDFEVWSRHFEFWSVYPIYSCWWEIILHRSFFAYLVHEQENYLSKQSIKINRLL